MAREHDFVEPHRRPIAEGHRDRVLAAPHRMNRCALVNVARQLRGEPGNVGVAAPGHDLPRRLRTQREQAMVVEEADERERGKRSDRVERGRPDGRRHGKEIPMGETLTETVGLEKVAQRLAFRIRRTEQRRRFPIEAHDLAEQGQVRRSHQVPPLREESVGAATAVLEPAPSARHGEGHVRVAGGHTEFPEQPHEVRIGAVVVHQEAGVERNGAVRAFDHHRVGVAAQSSTPSRRGVRGGGGSRNARRPSRKCPHRSPQRSSWILRNTSTRAVSSSICP